MQIESLHIILDMLDQNSKDFWSCLFRDHESLKSLYGILDLDCVDVSSDDSVKYFNSFSISIGGNKLNHLNGLIHLEISGIQQNGVLNSLLKMSSLFAVKLVKKE